MFQICVAIVYILLCVGSIAAQYWNTGYGTNSEYGGSNGYGRVGYGRGYGDRGYGEEINGGYRGGNPGYGNRYNNY